MKIAQALKSAVVLVMIAGTSSFAATSPSTIHVSLSGEGGSTMAIKLDRSSVEAGKVTFVVTNEAISENHEMVLIRLNDKNQTLPFLEDKHRIDESKVKSLGEVADLKPGDHGSFAATLNPGTYELLCNVKGHYEAGMHRLLTVTK